MKKRSLPLLAAAAAAVIGISLFFYGFELVSVPNVHEYHESLYVFAGILIFLAGVGLAFFAILHKPRPDQPPPAPPES